LRSEPAWLTAEQIVAVNCKIVEGTGEPHLLLQPALLESAWAKPINHWHYGEDDMVVLAVQLLLGIARDHCFEQGNKRTGFVCAVMFLELNGYELTATDSDHLGELVTRVIARQLAEERFTEILRMFIRQLP
jgi:death on curing protein